jgi:hypothetical protein
MLLLPGMSSDHLPEPNDGASIPAIERDVENDRAHRTSTGSRWQRHSAATAGIEYASPSPASDAVSQRSTDGWDVWEVEREGHG